jgi:hypothetical protein
VPISGLLPLVAERSGVVDLAMKLAKLELRLHLHSVSKDKVAEHFCLRDIKMKFIQNFLERSQQQMLEECCYCERYYCCWSYYQCWTV